MMLSGPMKSVSPVKYIYIVIYIYIYVYVRWRALKWTHTWKEEAHRCTCNEACVWIFQAPLYQTVSDDGKYDHDDNNSNNTFPSLVMVSSSFLLSSHVSFSSIALKQSDHAQSTLTKHHAKWANSSLSLHSLGNWWTNYHSVGSDALFSQ